MSDSHKDKCADPNINDPTMDDVEANDSYIDSVEHSPPAGETHVAVKAEIELLKPTWTRCLREKNPVITDMHLDALLSVKIAEAKKAIPKRWAAEKEFEIERAQAESLMSRMRKVLTAIKKKEIGDPSAEIEGRQLRHSITTWKSQRKSPLESVFHTVASTWVQPTVDPLANALSVIMEEMDELIATIEYEISSRGLFKDTATADGRMVTVRQEPKNMMHFDAARFVTKFNGAEDDEEVLFKFANFKASWDNVESEMKSMGGCTPKLMFLKLKDCLEGSALTLVSKYSAGSDNSYEAAMKDLLDRYEDPIGLASKYLKRAINPHQDQGKMADAMIQTYDALNNMRDQFDKDEVDMYDFAVIQSFTTAMKPEMQADWATYKIQKKQRFELAASSSPDPEQKWKRGMVENHKDFVTWLTAFRTRQPSSSVRQDEQGYSIATASNFAVSNSNAGHKCFLCKDLNTDNHPISRCPRGQHMTLKFFKTTCRAENKCFRCAREYSSNHFNECNAVCTICRGKMDSSIGGPHFALMCPNNRFREFSAAPPPRGGRNRGQGTKRKAQDDEDAGMAKMLKVLGQSVAKAMKEGDDSNKENSQSNSKKAEKK